MRHTYIYSPGRWSASGTYIIGGRRITMTSQTEITHDPGMWRLNENMVLLDGSGTVFSNRYEITPPSTEIAAVSWTSFNSVFGPLRGTFTVDGETITSSYASENGESVGTEIVTRINDNEYRAEGTLRVRGEVAGTWTENLRRALVRPDPDMMVLPVTEADIDAVHRVIVETWNDTYTGILSPETMQVATARWFDPSVLQRYVSDADVVFAKAVLSSGTIAGVIILSRHGEAAVAIGRVYVLPAFQRQGVGSMLLREGLRRFSGARVLRLEVEEHNAKAISFYGKQGFTRVNEIRQVLGSVEISVVVMEKILA